MKGVITAAGLGTRSGLDGKLRKEMLPVYDLREGRIVLRPILDVIITGFRDSGINEVAVILDPSDKWTEDYIKSQFSNIVIHYQEKKMGFGHAVLMAKEFVGEDSFILNAGDGMVLRKDILKSMVDWEPDGIILNLMEVPNPERYGTADILNQNGEIKVKGLIEKSGKPPSNYALCALYRLPHNIFEHLEAQTGTNIELTPAIDRLIRLGMETKASVIRKEEWVSVGRAEGYIHVLKSTLENCKK